MRRAHCINQIVAKAGKLRIERGYGLASDGQSLIRIGYDWADGHGASAATLELEMDNASRGDAAKGGPLPHIVLAGFLQACSDLHTCAIRLLIISFRSHSA
jgi:hypothetical protein